MRDFKWYFDEAEFQREPYQKSLTAILMYLRNAHSQTQQSLMQQGLTKTNQISS